MAVPVPVKCSWKMWIMSSNGPFCGSPVNSSHKVQWGRALMCSLICAWTNRSANNGDAGDLRWHRAHYDVTVMKLARYKTISKHNKVWVVYKCLCGVLSINIRMGKTTFLFFDKSYLFCLSWNTPSRVRLLWKVVPLCRFPCVHLFRIYLFFPTLWWSVV